MGEMPMSGAWTTSMMWMRMPGQTWLGAAASFVGMWVAMMVAMMLPSLVPSLRRYQRAVGGVGGSRLAGLTGLVGVGYFFVWAAVGVAVYPMGVALSATVMRQPALARFVPLAAGALVLIAGLIQFSRWKARRVVCCSESAAHTCRLQADASAAWRHGLRLGLECVQCCASLMMIPLVMGIMDLRVMLAVTVAITAERLAPAGVRAARVIGFVAVGAGVVLVARGGRTLMRILI